jgi:biotin carboxylase
VLPAESYRTDAFIRAASHSSDRIVVVTDGKIPVESSNVFQVATLDLSNIDLTPCMDWLASQNPDAVVGVDEQSVLLAAKLSDSLGLTQDYYPSVCLATDKIEFRETLKQAEIPQPRFVASTLSEVLESGFDPSHLETGDDVVIKPARCTASRGVIRTDRARLKEVAKSLASKFPANTRVIIEDYVAGKEIAVEGLIVQSELEILAISEKPAIGDGPYFWENFYLGPVTFDKEAEREISWLLTRSARALGLKDGPIHAELRLGEKYPAILEIAPRTIGGKCSAAFSFYDGKTLEQLVIERALGIKPQPILKKQAYGIYMIPSPGSGRIREVTGLAEASRIASVEITIKPGDLVEPPPFTDKYLGFAFVTAPTRTAVWKRLQEVAKLIKVELDPE